MTEVNLKEDKGRAYGLLLSRQDLFWSKVASCGKKNKAQWLKAKVIKVQTGNKRQFLLVRTINLCNSFSKEYNKFFHHLQSLQQNGWVPKRRSVMPLCVIVCYRKTGWNLWPFFCNKSDNMIIMAPSKCISVFIQPSKSWAKEGFFKILFLFLSIFWPKNACRVCDIDRSSIQRP